MKPSELFTEITGQTGLYNIQAIDNIPSIMQWGLLSNERAEHIKHTSIAMQEIQDRRDTVIIPNGLSLHKYANVYFDPRNPMLYKRKAENFNICILKLAKEILDIEGAVVSDRNASSRYAGFYSPETGLKEIDFKLVYATDWRDENEYVYYKRKSVKCAEVLIPNVIPYNYILCAAVCNDETKAKLKSIGFNKQIFVAPEFFF